ncbi:Glyoxalase/Bleomycin resistance protein/Dihydroxybiphenyl dioxygenase [Xylaria castorea]|nr:Glyoxalase/Bleomycin resistance protein/Dihydroxybiphenyl dioxygenase [Xylaria castorea]
MADSNSSKVLSPKQLAHIVLKTQNLKTLSTFYKTFLGAHANYENEQLAFLTYDDEHHRIAMIEVPGLAAKDQNTAGLDHMSFTYETLDDLLTAYKQRKALGFLPVWSIHHGPTISIYYMDPDGNRIETQIDTFDSVEETNAYMTGGEFAKNPIGVSIDPEDLISKLENGTPVSELKKPLGVGARGPETIPWYKG